MSFNQFPARFGKYIVLDRISVGGMAEVYRAKELRESGFGKIIALKRMLGAVETDAVMAPMFVDEAKLAAQLVHPNIAQTLELGRIDNSLYIAMELIWGRDLKSITKACSAKHLPIPVGVAAYVIAKAAEALDFAHNAPGPDGKPMKLVHRDVSPHNLMLDFDGEVKVIDFGVAKAEVKSTETVAGVIKGKFSYMAPEQVIGSHVDARTDIFALGIVLYELISGERLYDGSSAFSIFDKVVNQPAPRLGNVAQVAPELDEIVGRCLAKRPEERFDNASQLADALAPFRIHERSIVGPRETKQLLKVLFPDDEADMRERLQRYQTIRECDCVDVRVQVAPRTGYTEVLAAMDDAPQFLDLSSPGVSAPTSLYDPSLPGRLTPPPPPPEDSGVRALPGRRTTDEVEAPPPRRGPAVLIGLTALAASVLVVVAHLEGVPPLALVQRAVDLATGSAPPATAAAPPAPKSPAQPEARPPPLPVVTTSTLPPRPQVGSVESASGGEVTAAPTAGASPSPPAHAPEPARPTGGKKNGRQGAHTTSSRVAQVAPAKEGFGYVSVGAKGAGSAKVFVDGREIGYAPVLNCKLKLGSHSLKVVPYKDELPGTPVSQDFVVTKENTPGSPLRLVVELN